MKIEDVETLIDDVADIAYDKAVEVVTDTVRVETHKEDIRLIEETKTWLQSPERKAPKKERDYAISRLDGVIGKIKMPCSLHCRKSSPDFFRRRSRKRAKSRLRKRSSPPSLPDLKETRNWQNRKMKRDGANTIRTKNRIWSFKALAIFDLRMTGAFSILGG